MAEKNSADLIARGSYNKSPLGSTVFAGLRTLDIFIQYGILAKGLAKPLLNLLHITPAVTNPYSFVALGLPVQPLIILAMAAGSAVKQIYWQLGVSNETMEVKPAILVGVFNTVFNSTNSILALTSASSYLIPSFLTSTDNATNLSPIFIFGTIAYTIGILSETFSEIQRKNFKADPKNAGKPFTGGLFSLARHINYGSYTIWRSGYALAAGGWIPATLVAAFFGYDFANRGVPMLDEYCSKRVSEVAFDGR